ncbi:hypothetical protein KAH37_03980 [bacterium]|nr:hypothetical protein [bacterium]
MKLLKISMVFILLLAAMLFSACSDGNTGDLKINLKLPMSLGRGCDTLTEGGDVLEDYTYDQCFVPEDKITISVYRKAFPSDDYLYVQQEVITVTDKSMWGGKFPYIRTLTTGSYYKFFVVVTNKNQKIKMAGGVEGVVYDSAKNKSISIFLSNVADFARVTTDGKDEGSISTYVESLGSKGVGAAALQDGRVFMTGGYSVDTDTVLQNTILFNPSSLSKNGSKSLPTPLWDHSMATLRDGSESGKVIIAFGKTSAANYSSSVYSYDPEADKYISINNIAGRTGTRSLQSADGSVYIFGGCDAAKAFGDVLKVDAKTGKVGVFTKMNTARCYHSVADLSYEDDNGFHPRFLIVGGLTKDASIAIGDYVTGEAFAELLTDAGSTPIKLVPASEFDVPKRLAYQASAGITWVTAATETTAETRAFAASVVGGVLFAEDKNSTTTSQSLYSIYKVGKDWMINRNTSPLSCAFPTMAQIPSIYETKLAAVNCGPALDSGQAATELPNRNSSGLPQMFVLQLNRTNYNGKVVVSAAARISINGADFVDQPNSLYTYIDGPTVVNSTGQAYLLGSHYIYKASGYTAN